MSLKGRKILITSGGTLEKWDQVRGHTNLAKGNTGCYLAEEALKRGANVFYLHGYFAKLPAYHPNIQLIQFEGVNDLREKIRKIVVNETIYSVIMTAAVSDWVIDRIIRKDGKSYEDLGKIPSEEPPIIHFKKAPKVITEIKDWNPNVFLVGFKFEHNDNYDYLVTRAKQRMEMWRADCVVANSTVSLTSSENTNHIILSKDGTIKTFSQKNELSQRLINIIEYKTICT